MKNIKKFSQVLFVLVLLLLGIGNVAYADINLIIRDGSTKIFEGVVPLPPAGTISLNDSDDHSHDIDTESVFGLLGSLDQTNADFEISEITDFGFSLYLKCITYLSGGEKCDNWQYTVDGSYPDVGMDAHTLSGTENVYVYFGPQNQVVLNSNSMTTSDTLTVTAQTYDYENNAWTNRNGVLVGLTQPNPDNPFSPIEILTSTTDGNGQVSFSSIPVGSYDVGVKESSSFGDFYNSLEMESLTVATPTPSPSSGSSSSGSRNKKKIEESVLGAETKISFDTKKAFEFLLTQQKENGSFGEEIYTDWSALALASGNYQAQAIKLIKYFGESKIKGALLTDYERHAMALMSLGLNPHNTNGENYIEKITASFDGKQFGDVNEDNDDIFALIVLQNAGYKQEEKMINDSITFILGRQKENGSWDESIDMTGASIEALSLFGQSEQLKNALLKAKEFLNKNQKDNGGWGNNASSTAWAIGGIVALNEKPEDWKKGDNTPLDYLATLQDTDGGIKNEDIKSKVWETAYVISALSGKTWNQIMQKFEKPKTLVIAETEQKQASKKIVATKKLENLASQNVATTITAVTPSTTTTKIETPKRGWFRRFLENIFGF